MAVLGLRIKVALIVVAMAAGLLGASMLANDSRGGDGDRRISVENLTHKGGHKRPPGCDKNKGKGGYNGNPGKKCRNHNGQPPPGKAKGKGKSKGKSNK